MGGTTKPPDTTSKAWAKMSEEQKLTDIADYHNGRPGSKAVGSEAGAPSGSGGGGPRPAAAGPGNPVDGGGCEPAAVPAEARSTPAGISMLERWAQDGPPAAIDMAGEKCPSQEITCGDCIKIGAKKVKKLLIDINKTSWPTQSRKSVQGKGACLGITYNGSKAFVGPDTHKAESLVKRINTIVRKVVKDDTFTWS